MREAYFIFNNKKSSDFGIAITFENLPPVERAEEDVEIIEVPGRDGYLTRSNNRRKPIEKIITCQLLKEEYRKTVRNWLQGKGRLILSNEDDVFFDAKVLNPVKFYWNIFGGYDFDVEFLCQPNAYLHEGHNAIEINNKNTIVYNPGTEISRPYIKIFGSGEIDLIVNNSISRYNINEYIEIDSEIMECYKGSSPEIFKGDFPLLTLGENKISWNGNVDRIEVVPRWCR